MLSTRHPKLGGFFRVSSLIVGSSCCSLVLLVPCSCTVLSIFRFELTNIFDIFHCGCSLMFWRKSCHDIALKNSVFDLSFLFSFSFLTVPSSPRLFVFHFVGSASFSGSVPYLFFFFPFIHLKYMTVFILGFYIFCMFLQVNTLCIVCSCRTLPGWHICS